MSWRKNTLRGDGQTTQGPEELLDRGVRLVFESGRPIAQVARDLGITPEVLRKRGRQAEADTGGRRICRPAPSVRRGNLPRENHELRRANEISIRSRADPV